MNYGLPYAGSKSQFANKILDALPPADTFVDLFAGGCSMTHAAMLSGKYKHFIANDINPQIVQLFKDAVDGKYKDEERWISKEDWLRLKDTDAYVKYCWSFSNGGVSYQYGEEIEPYKKALHYAVFWGDFEQLRALCPEVADACEERLRDIADRKQRRTEMGRAIVERLKEIGDYDLVMSNPLYKTCRWKESSGWIKSPAHLQSLVTMERLERVQGLQGAGGVDISGKDYQSVDLPDNAAIYCDIPYKVDTFLKRGVYGGGFDFLRYYDWVRSQDRVIYTSEYTMPDDFMSIWEYTKHPSFTQKEGKYVTERLFVHESQMHNVPKTDLFGYDHH